MFSFSFKKKKSRVAEIQKSLLPKIRTKIFPGPQSVKLTESLKRYECPQITYVGGAFPVFFNEGRGANLFDVDGNRYLDLSSCFGVVGIGHGNPAVLKAVHDQSRRMMHGMGDVHPNEIKIAFQKRLSEVTPGNLSQSILSSTGSEAVESALKTAVMATKKTGVIAFTGAYHGLGYGALSVTHREDFKKPFLRQLGSFSYTAPFPDVRALGPKASEISLKTVQKIVKKNRRSKNAVGAILIEPIQGRGGILSAPNDFMKALRALCDEEKILLIADEVFSGFGRTGSYFAVEKSGVLPDLLCVGKGMANGFPFSACIGSARLMYNWGASTGDAIHTSTFLGNPLGSAVALAVIKEIEEKKLVDRSKNMGDLFRKELWKLKEKYPIISDVRGAGLMIGIEFSRRDISGRSKKMIPATDAARAFVGECLKNGVVLLGSGPDHNVVSITPPFIISEKEIIWCATLFDKILKQIHGPVA